jgi:hypothetical protein
MSRRIVTDPSARTGTRRLGRSALLAVLGILGVAFGFVLGLGVWAASSSFRTGLLVASGIGIIGWLLVFASLRGLTRSRLVTLFYLVASSVASGVLFGAFWGALRNDISQGIEVGTVIVISALILSAVMVRRALTALGQVTDELVVQQRSDAATSLAASPEDPQHWRRSAL